MNTSNLVRRNSTIFKFNDFKAMIIGILLIAVLVASNTYGTAFAQDCYKVQVTITGLPKQTDDVSTQIDPSNTGPTGPDAKGTASISIPGIGSGQVVVLLQNDPSGGYTYRVQIGGLPSQTGASKFSKIPTYTVCDPHPHPVSGDINIIGIGVGSLTITTAK